VKSVAPCLANATPLTPLNLEFKYFVTV
jgi:hypothetical protein